MALVVRRIEWTWNEADEQTAQIEALRHRTEILEEHVAESIRRVYQRVIRVDESVEERLAQVTSQIGATVSEVRNQIEAGRRVNIEALPLIAAGATLETVPWIGGTLGASLWLAAAAVLLGRYVVYRSWVATGDSQNL